MSDDTTTWLKKNPAINPLQRTLKTSLRFHVPSSDMNTSIMSNPDKVKDQGVFIPRMLLKSTMRKSRAHEFKVPEMVVPKPGVKKEGLGSGAKQKKISTPNRVRKSFLPIPKTKGPSSEKVTVKSNNIPRPSFAPGGSGRAARREMIKKVVELSEMKRKEDAERQVKMISGDSSVLRSILKKRASLRRSSQTFGKKPKVKKVLFDGFENNDGEKENDLTLETQNDFNTALDEPTVFLNLPNGVNMDDSLFEPAKPQLNWTVEETKDTTQHDSDIRNIVKLWESYKDNLESIKTERSSVEELFQSLLEHSLSFQKQYKSYKETSEELYGRLSKIGEEIEENLKRVMGGGDHSDECHTPKAKRRSSGRRETEKVEKIKMSDKSKVIKRSSGRKSVPLLKKDFLNNMDDSFSIVSKSSFLRN